MVELAASEKTRPPQVVVRALFRTQVASAVKMMSTIATPHVPLPTLQFLSTIAANDQTSVMDSTSILRLAADGSPWPARSWQSANYQSYVMMVTPSGYLSYTAWNGASRAQNVNMSFDFVMNPDGSFNMSSHMKTQKGVPLVVGYGTYGVNGCGINQNGLRAQFPPAIYNLTAMRLAFPNAAPASYANIQNGGAVTGGGVAYSNQTIILDSLANVFGSTYSSNGAYSYSCNGAAVVGVYPNVTWQNLTAQWTIVPALACPAVCGYQTFSLQAVNADPSGVTYLYVSSTTGQLVVGSRSSADFSTTGASFLSYYATVSGTSGWVIASAIDYSVGNVLTNTLTTTASCGTANLISTAPIPATGLGTQHLWHMFWVDGAGDLTSIPNAANEGMTVASATLCATPSVTPTLTNTPTVTVTPTITATATASASFTPSQSQTPSQTSTNTGSPSNTPSQTSSPSHTPSHSPSPSVTPSVSPSPSSTQVVSFSNTPSTSLTGTSAATTSLTPSAAATVTRSATATNTRSPGTTPSPSPSTLINVAGSLWVSLWASDYNAATIPQTWDNRATPGPVSFTNGDFTTGTNPLQFPTLQTIGGVPAVVFNVSLDGVADNVSSALSYFPVNQAFYHANPWTIEYWIYHTGWENAGYVNAVAQLSLRPGTICDSFNLNMGSHPNWGSLSFYACDYAWTTDNSNPVDVGISPASGGWKPLPYMWHHVVYSYTGVTGANPYLLSMYLNGNLYRQTAIQLAIKYNFNPTIGTWNDNFGNFALAQFHIHSGAMSQAQVTNNYNTYAALYIPTQTPTPTSTSSPSGTQLYSLSTTPSPSQTATSTATPTSTTLIQIAKSLLVDLHASDYNPVANNWDNVATPGAVSLVNLDFVSAGSANNPVLSYVGPLASPAVVFNVSLTGTAQYLIGNTTAPQLAGMYGGSDWSLEYWGWTNGFMGYGNNAENPVYMYAPRPATACQAAFWGMGSDPAWGVGGHYGCDDYFQSTSDLGTGYGSPTVSYAGHGYGPSPRQWHHIVVTYTGNSAPVQYETIYIDGQMTTQLVGRSLNIQTVRSARVCDGYFQVVAMTCHHLYFLFPLHDSTRHSLTPAGWQRLHRRVE